MTAGQINRELDRLRNRSEKLSARCIEAGRGHERAQEILTMTDPLAIEYRTLHERQMSLRREFEHRMGTGSYFRYTSLPRGGAREQ